MFLFRSGERITILNTEVRWFRKIILRKSIQSRQAEFKVFKPLCWTAKYLFQKSAGSNLETINTISNGTNHVWDAAQESNSLDSASALLAIDEIIIYKICGHFVIDLKFGIKGFCFHYITLNLIKFVCDIFQFHITRTELDYIAEGVQVNMDINCRLRFSMSKEGHVKLCIVYSLYYEQKIVWLLILFLKWGSPCNLL